MVLKIDLSRSPYFDDYDETKNFYRVLYKPAAAVQARELNQMQTIMQDQINKFGRFVFKNGSVVEGCTFTFDRNYDFVKINDEYANGAAISSLSDFIGCTLTNSANLQAIVVNTFPGFQSDEPDLNTLYIKYLNTATNGSQQKIYANNDGISITSSSNVYIGNVTVATPSNSATSSVGKGYALTTTEGVIFMDGFFVRVEPQTIVVSKYDNTPDNVSVGFNVNELVITPETDTSLYDNAAGSPNYRAPGAHRLKLVPALTVKTTDNVTYSNTFFSLCDFKSGYPITLKNDPQLAALGKQLAERSYETNGDYVVNPFLFSVSNKNSNDVSYSTHLNLSTSKGVAYVKGYRVEFINTNISDLRKGLDTESIIGQTVSQNFGYYFNVKEFCGDFNNDSIVQLELHSAAKTAITTRNFLNVSYSTSTRIGTAYCRGVAYTSGDPGSPGAVYKIYMFNVIMNPGKNINDVRSIIYYSSGVKAVADIILTRNATTATDVAVIQDTTNEIMMHPFGQKALTSNGFSTTAQFVYRNRSNATFSTGNSVITVASPTAAGTGTEQFNTTAATELERTILVIPTTSGYSANNTGTVTLSSSSNTVSGSSTAFLSDYYVGDFIYSNTETRRITSITNNTYLAVDSAFTTNASSKIHQTVYPAGVPINFIGTNRSITATTSLATINLIKTVNASFTASVYFDVLRKETVAQRKVLRKNTYIRIQANTNPAGVNGPWCLGVPDVIRINHVYINDTGVANTSSPDRLANFSLDNGQRDAYYDLAYISSKKTLQKNASLLIDVDNFTIDDTQGRGFFTANSYPIDDANTANTQAITTQEIPVYYSKKNGIAYDLRDSVDFRPYATATANAAANVVASATLNPSNTTAIYVTAQGSYIPSPDTNFQSDLSYFLPRKDRIVLTSDGALRVVEGKSSVTPILPNEPPSSMTIGTVDIPAYPSLTPTDARAYNRYEYSVQTNIQQIRRYTMSDIGKLDKRITRLEYYTSLTLLEQSTNSLNVRSDETGQNRFKNGIFVESFKDHSLGNVYNPKYSIAIDERKQEARPRVNVYNVNMYLDTSVSTAKKTGEIVTLPYDDTTGKVLKLQQPYASAGMKVSSTGLSWTGRMILDPPGSLNPDISYKPDIVNNIDTSQNWAILKRAWGTSWGSWTNSGDPSVTTNTKTSTSISGSTTTTTTTTTTSVAQEQSKSGSKLNTSTSSTDYVIGNFVTNIAILPYIKNQVVTFIANGLKPNTRMYAFFENVDVTDYCCQLEKWTGATPSWDESKKSYYTTTGKKAHQTINNGWFVYNDAITFGNMQVDSSGNLYGIFIIPNNTFNVGELQFKLLDISNLQTSYNLLTSQATATFVGIQLATQQSRSKLTIRSAELSYNDVSDTQTIYSSTTSTSTNSVTEKTQIVTINQPVTSAQPLPDLPTPITNIEVPVINTPPTSNEINLQPVSGGSDNSQVVFVDTQQTGYSPEPTASTDIGYSPAATPPDPGPIVGGYYTVEDRGESSAVVIWNTDGPSAQYAGSAADYAAIVDWLMPEIRSDRE